MPPSVFDGNDIRTGLIAPSPDFSAEFDLLLIQDRCRRKNSDSPSLEEFVFWNDRHLYDRDIGRAYLTDQAQVKLFNSSSSLEELHVSLKTLHLDDEQRLRPNWDQYFMQLASLAAQRSNCMKRRVGCVLVRERRVISTGYNGTPRHLKNCNQGGCMYPCHRDSGGFFQTVTPLQAQDATVALGEASAFRHVFVSMPRKTHCWKLERSAYEKGQSYTVTREPSRLLIY